MCSWDSRSSREGRSKSNNHSKKSMPQMLVNAMEESLIMGLRPSHGKWTFFNTYTSLTNICLEQSLQTKLLPLSPYSQFPALRNKWTIPIIVTEEREYWQGFHPHLFQLSSSPPPSNTHPFSFKKLFWFPRTDKCRKAPISFSALEAVIVSVSVTSFSSCCVNYHRLLLKGKGPCCSLAGRGHL